MSSIQAPARPVLLAVDDELGIRESYAILFEDRMDVVQAESAERAVGAAKHQRFDAILLDVRMPGMSGLEVFEPLRALQPGVPIVFVTAVENVVTPLTALRLGAFDALLKPFEIEPLVNVVRRAVVSRTGTVSVVADRPEWNVISAHNFREKIYASPAIDGESIYVRTEKALYSFK